MLVYLMSESRIIQISPPKPHSVKQNLIMSAFMVPGITEIYVCSGSKFGKSISAAAGIANGIVSKQGALWRWVAPIYEQTKIGFSYCKDMLPPEPITKASAGNLEIYIPDIRSSIKFHHAGNPVSLEGQAVSGYVFDEAAKMKEEVYASAKTTRTVTRGPMLFISTPYGKNWFYRKCMEAKEEMARATFEKRMPTKIFITAPTSDNPFVPRQSIEEARAELPARLFRQYFLAEFVDDGSVFTGYQDCMDGTHIDLFGEHQHWFRNDADECDVVIGADWAKMTDWTVFFAISMTHGIARVVGFERFHRKTYTEAIRNLVRFSRRFKKVEVVYHDKTGVGVAIDDQLAFTDLNYVGINFTNQSKSEMVNRLMTAFEQKQIIIPKWNVLHSELDSFEVKVNATGSMSYNAANGSHDDTICALMLANQAALQYGDRNLEVKFLEDLPRANSTSTLSNYYNNIIDDYDE